MYRLHKRRRGAAAAGLSCDETGLFLGDDCPLVLPLGQKDAYAAASLDDVRRGLSAAYGIQIDAEPLMPALSRVASFMSEERWGVAKVAALQLRLPDVADVERLIKRISSEPLERFNPNHYGPGTRGGQFAPATDDDNGSKAFRAQSTGSAVFWTSRTARRKYEPAVRWLGATIIQTISRLAI